jgi:serine protease Do/serine protease DegQ
MKVVEIERGSPLFQRLRGGGVIVSAVEPDSRALQAGFRPGDIVYAVNRQRVQTLAEFQAALKGGAGNPVAVSLLRGDFNITITLR